MQFDLIILKRARKGQKTRLREKDNLFDSEHIAFHQVFVGHPHRDDQTWDREDLWAGDPDVVSIASRYH